MKRLLLSSILVILNVIIINNAAAGMDYNGLKFELPISLKEAVNTFDLDSEKSLRKGDIDNREVLVHKGENNDVIGVTFYKKCESYKKLEDTHKYDYSELEEKYKKKFKAFDFSFFTSLDGKHYLMPLESGATVVLGDVMYNSASNNYVTVSFFQNVSAKKILLSLNTIY